MSDPGVVTPAAGTGLNALSSSPLNRFYHDLFEGALLAIYVSRPDGGLVACNAAFARLVGFTSASDAVGSSMSGLYDDPADRDRFVAAVRERGRLERHQLSDEAPRPAPRRIS